MEDKDKDKEKPPLSAEEKGSCINARTALALMAFWGFFNVYCLRVNLSVALVAMVNSTAPDTNSTNTSVECPESSSNSTSTSSGEFNWDETSQGLILGAFFYGYIVTQLPGGWLAERIGGKKLFGFGCVGTAVLTLVTPVAARAGLPYLVAVRVLEGIFEGVTFPSMHAMWSSWAPIYERSRLVGFSYSGGQLGTVFAMPISGVLCEQGFAGGWPSVFYVFGISGCIWFVCWMLLVHDSPSQHPRISASERAYIESSIGHRQPGIATPWLQIARSPAVWAVTIAHFANNWGFYSMLTTMPTYMKKILHFEIAKNGALSGLPYIILWLAQITAGLVADFIRHRGFLSTGSTRKLFNTLGSVLPITFLIATGYAGCDHTLAVVFLTLGVGGAGFTMGGYNVNHLDIAPRFAGTLLGITNAVATIPGFAGPALVGYLTKGNQTAGQWRIFFFITAGISTFGALMFIIFGSGEEQSWAKVKGEQDCSVQNTTYVDTETPPELLKDQDNGPTHM